MIDIHCHILPGIDDGPKTIDESVAMARIAFKDGIRTIIATPHTGNGRYNCLPEDIMTSCVAFNEILVKKRIGLKVLPGSEVRLCPDIIENYKKNKIMNLGSGNFVLIELPHQFIQRAVVDVIRAFKFLGVTPIIAHPERNQQVMNNNSAVDQFVFAGALIQITAGSLLGLFGRRVRQVARDFVANGSVHFVATDAHSSDKRAPVLSKGLKQFEKIAGYEGQKTLVQNFEMVLQETVIANDSCLN